MSTVKVIEAVNVAHGLAQFCEYIRDNHVVEESRNGPVMVAPGPVATVYRRPRERVLVAPTRDANPFFHFMEALWMLAGRNDLAWPLHFNSRFAAFSDDGEKIRGAYGWRWRDFFGYDQLRVIAEHLRSNPQSRRAVLTMWDPVYDTVQGMNSRDVPCNTQAYFDVRGGKLNMTVTNRSNDAIWGAYGANAVHFSMLQEYLASFIGVSTGDYVQFSNNMHVYTDVFDAEYLRKVALECWSRNLYTEGHARPFKMVNSPIDQWDNDLCEFLRNPASAMRAGVDPFFSTVAFPMYMSWQERKNKTSDGFDWAMQIAASDWRIACTEWIQRRGVRA